MIRIPQKSIQFARDEGFSVFMNSDLFDKDLPYIYVVDHDIHTFEFEKTCGRYIVTTTHIFGSGQVILEGGVGHAAFVIKLSDNTEAFLNDGTYLSLQRMLWSLTDGDFGEVILNNSFLIGLNLSVLAYFNDTCLQHIDIEFSDMITTIAHSFAHYGMIVFVYSGKFVDMFTRKL